LSLDLIPAESADYGRWWGTSEGQWLYKRIQERIGKPLVLWVGRVYGPRYEAMDVANSAVDVMSSRFIVASLQRADDQWAYLAAVLKRELIQQAGGFFRDDPEEEAASELRHDDSQYTPIIEAVQRTTECLRVHTPASVQPHLEELVYYFAEHGYANLSRLHTAASRDPELLARGLLPRQILAVANAVLGCRPNHGESSILGGFIQDRDWIPENSMVHVHALNKYATRMSSHSMGMTSSRLALVS
jgi:hypothetical protein